jgi:hypothetical protein
MLQNVSRFVFVIVAALSVSVMSGLAAAAWKQQSAAACHINWGGAGSFSPNRGAGPGYVYCPVEETSSFRVNSVTALKLDFTGAGAYVYTCSELAGGFGAVCSPPQFFSGTSTDWKTVRGEALAPWSDPHATAAFRYFVLILGVDTYLRGYLLEHN